MTSQTHPKDDAARCNRTTPSLESPSVGGLHQRGAKEYSSRRSFLQMTMGGTVAGFAAVPGMEFVAPRPALAQTTLSPDAALQELTDGNKRFTAARLTACDPDLAILKEHTIEKQEPFAAVLSCVSPAIRRSLLARLSVLIPTAA